MQHHERESETMKKQRKYMKQCKEALWKRWKHEYLEVCKEKHNLKHKDKTFKINVGDLLMVKGKKKIKDIGI